MVPAYCAIASFAFFLLVDKKISPNLSTSVPEFRKLTADQKTEWHARCSSSVHAAFVTFIAIYVLMFEESLKENMIWGRSVIAECNVAVTVGFLACDLYLMAMYFKVVGGTWNLVIHHIVAIYAYIYGLCVGCLVYVANFRLLAELSTPFLNLRWVLSVTGNKQSTMYFYNGLLLIFMFFVSRIMLMPYFWYMALNITRLEDYSKVTTTIHVSWIGVCFVLDVLNLLWMKKMVAGMVKHVSDMKAHQNDNSLQLQCNSETPCAKLD